MNIELISGSFIIVTVLLLRIIWRQLNQIDLLERELRTEKLLLEHYSEQLDQMEYEVASLFNKLQKLETENGTTN